MMGWRHIHGDYNKKGVTFKRNVYWAEKAEKEGVSQPVVKEDPEAKYKKQKFPHSVKGSIIKDQRYRRFILPVEKGWAVIKINYICSFFGDRTNLLSKMQADIALSLLDYSNLSI